MGRFEGRSQIVWAVSFGHQPHFALAGTPADCATGHRGIYPREAARCVWAHHNRLDAVSPATRLSIAPTHDDHKDKADRRVKTAVNSDAPLLKWVSLI